MDSNKASGFPIGQQQLSKDEQHRKQVEYAHALQHDQMGTQQHQRNDPGIGGGGFAIGGSQQTKEEKQRKQMEYAHSLQSDQYQQQPGQLLYQQRSEHPSLGGLALGGRELTK